MKHLVVCLLSLSGMFGLAQSKTWENSGSAPGVINTGYNRTPLSITQNSDTTTITTPLSVACPGDNDSYLRLFDLDGEFGVTGPYTVESIDFGIESFATLPNLDITVNVYSIASGSAFEYANLTLLGTNTINFAAATAGTIVNFPVTGTIMDPAADDLVVEIFAPDSDAGGTWFIGSNSNGQTADGFLSSAVCGAPEPTSIAALGFPTMHFIMVVNGDVQDCAVTAITANNSSVTISGDCASGLDVWCQSPATGDVLLATGVVVDGSASISLPSFTPDAIYYTTRPGETGIANAIDGVVSNRTVPTLGEWGLLAFITLLMGSALVMMKKQRTA